MGIVDQVIAEPAGGAQNNPAAVFLAVDRALSTHLAQLEGQDGLDKLRWAKYRAMGNRPAAKEET